MSTKFEIEYVKKAITSEAGWSDLAKAVKSAADQKVAREECESVLKKIGEDPNLTLPEYLGAPKGAMTIQIQLSDLLLHQLNEELHKLK